MTPVFSSEYVDFFSSISFTNTTLFMLGGRRPDVSWLRDFGARNGPELWAVDSGVAACRDAGLTPAVIIGDKDSAPASDWEWAVSHGAEEFLHPSAKNLTDFQLALDLLRERDESAALVLSGCFGGRFDHLYSVFNSFARDGSFSMIDDVEGLFLIPPGEEASASFKRLPLAVSLLPLSEICCGVSITGVRWPLDSVILKRAYPWTVSNEVSSSDGRVRVRCEEGMLGFYWSYKGTS